MDDLIERLRAASAAMRSHYAVGAIELIPTWTMDEAAAELRTLRAELERARQEGWNAAIEAAAQEVLEWFPDGAESSGPAFTISSAIRALTPAVIIAADADLVYGTLGDSDGDDGA
jgi:hypothetical protein